MAEKEKFGINDLAKEMGVEAATARIALRKKGVKKSGRAYEWNSRSEVKAVASKLTGKAEKVKKPKKEKEAA